MTTIRLLRVMILGGLMAAFVVFAHEKHASVTYLGNEAIYVQDDGAALLFDPFFAETFGIYHAVPEAIARQVSAAQPPFRPATVMFISHAHDDHFNAQRVGAYLQRHVDTHLVAPKQAIDKLKALEISTGLSTRIHPISLAFGSPAAHLQVSGVKITAIRIPHAGWPGRQNIENILFRVQTAAGHSLMHLGDANVDIDHYLPYRSQFEVATQLAFVPYWFYQSAEGRDIIRLLNADSSHGMHVPIKLPAFFQSGDYPLLTVPGKTWQMPH